MITDFLILLAAPLYAIGYVLGVCWRVLTNGFQDGRDGEPKREC